MLPGTFARVWLARLKDRNRGRSQVYALKILRKADGEETVWKTWRYLLHRANARLLCIYTVIKLKQVEHVRNERKTLRAIRGHPFMTTLVATFSDDQCLYMLVRDPMAIIPPPCFKSL